MASVAAVSFSSHITCYGGAKNQPLPSPARPKLPGGAGQVNHSVVQWEVGVSLLAQAKSSSL